MPRDRERFRVVALSAMKNSLKTTVGNAFLGDDAVVDRALRRAMRFRPECFPGPLSELAAGRSITSASG
jgi:hypothetical protein